jgi:hypothetical protein
MNEVARMKSRKKKVCLTKWWNHGEYIPLEVIYKRLQDIQAQLVALEIPFSNVRLNLGYDTYLDGDDIKREVFNIQVWYDTDMTEEDLEEEREFLKVRKAEQEAGDKLQFEKLKKHYGWN